jgi:PAS domain S-box-containing protein
MAEGGGHPPEDVLERDGILGRLFATGPSPQFLIRSPEARILRANPAACALLGYPEGALDDVPSRQMIPRSAAELCPLLLEAERGGAATGEATALTREQAPLSVKLEATWIPLEDGAVIHVVLHDQTREKALEESKARYDSLLGSLPDLFFEKDVFGAYRDCNPELERCLGRSREEILGRTDYELLSAEQAREFRAEDRQVLEWDGLAHHERWVTYPDGQPVLLDMLKTLSYGPDGRPAGVLGVGRDVTERHRAQQKLAEEERRYRHMLSVTPEGFWMGDYHTLETLDVNDSFCRMLGYFREELLGSTPLEWLAPEDTERFLQEAEKRWDQEHRQYEITLLAKDGHPVPVLANVATFRDEEGTPKYSFGFINDISQLKHTKQALSRLAEILEATPEVVGLADRDLHIFYLNPAAVKLLGFLPNGGAHVRDFHPEWAARRVLEEGIPRARQEGVWMGETALLSRDGREVPFLQTLVAHYDDQGEVERYSTIAHDLSTQKRAEQREQRYREQLDYYGRLISMTEVVSLLSHQLSQPLTATANFATAAQQILATEGADSPRIPELLEKLTSNAQKAGEILANVRGYMKGEGPAFRKVDLNQVIREMAPYLETSSLEEGEHLELDLAEAVVPVRADPFQIQEILANLVRNAAESNRQRHTESPLPVEVGTRPVVGGVQITVRDRGVGLPTDLSLDNPEPFFSTKEGGLGLGLWIAHSLVETHKGRLEAKANTDGPGATFRFILPVAESEA